MGLLIFGAVMVLAGLGVIGAVLWLIARRRYRKLLGKDSIRWGLIGSGGVIAVIGVALLITGIAAQQTKTAAARTHTPTPSPTITETAVPTIPPVPTVTPIPPTPTPTRTPGTPAPVQSAKREANSA